MCCIQILVKNNSNGNDITRKGNNDRSKKHRNVLYPKKRTSNASPVGNIHLNYSHSISSSPSILISTVLFVGHPAPSPQTLLATPLAFNSVTGSSRVSKPPLASLQRLTFILADVSNGTMLMHRGRTPTQTKWTPGLSANDLSNSVYTG